MAQRVINTPNIEVLYNTETQVILGDGRLVSAVKVINNETKEVKEIPISGFFVARGHTPNTSIFAQYLTLDNEGYIQNVPGSTRTNVEGVFVAGDAVDRNYRQAIIAAGSGAMAALDAERYLASLEN